MSRRRRHPRIAAPLIGAVRTGADSDKVPHQRTAVCNDMKETRRLRKKICYGAVQTLEKGMILSLTSLAVGEAWILDERAVSSAPGFRETGSLLRRRAQTHL